MTVKTNAFTRRINGQIIPCFERRDGVQRIEWVGSDGTSDAQYGSITKSRHAQSVVATRPSGETRTFAVFKYGCTTEQAFAAARIWLVGSAQIEKEG